MSWFIAAIFLTGVGGVIGMESYLGLTRADEHVLQAVSFALISVGTMVGFDSAIPQGNRLSPWVFVGLLIASLFVTVLVAIIRSKPSARLVALDVDDGPDKQRRHKSNPDRHEDGDISRSTHPTWNNPSTPTRARSYVNQQLRAESLTT
jgi:hypothetical protein